MGSEGDGAGVAASGAVEIGLIGVRLGTGVGVCIIVRVGLTGARVGALVAIAVLTGSGVAVPQAASRAAARTRWDNFSARFMHTSQGKHSTDLTPSIYLPAVDRSSIPLPKAGRGGRKTEGIDLARAVKSSSPCCSPPWIEIP
jgi:hypothetical protein